jgi:hypothetical protein
MSSYLLDTTLAIDRNRQREQSRSAENVAARQGFEPRYAAPEAAVLPLNDRAVQEF